MYLNIHTVDLVSQAYIEATKNMTFWLIFESALFFFNADLAQN